MFANQMDIYQRLIASGLSVSDAFKTYLVSQGILPAARIHKPLNINIPQVQYTTYPKARVMQEGEPAQIPLGAAHIVYDTRVRDDTYTLANADEYLGIPCPRTPYPRPMIHQYRIQGTIGSFYELRCPIDSIAPSKYLAMFQVAAIPLNLRIYIESKYDEEAIRSAAAGTTTQEEARQVIRSMGIDREYPNYIATLRRLAGLSGEPISNICINTEDPFTLEDLESVPRNMIVKFGRTLDGKKYCASAQSLFDYVAPKVRILQPLTNPFDRSDLITQEDLDNLYRVMRQNNPEFVEPQIPILVEGEISTESGVQFRTIELIMPPTGNSIQPSVSRMGEIPLGVSIPGTRYTSENLLEMILDPSNTPKLVKINEIYGRLYVGWRTYLPFESENFLQNGRIDADYFQRVFRNVQNTVR